MALAASLACAGARAPRRGRCCSASQVLESPRQVWLVAVMARSRLRFALLALGLAALACAPAPAEPSAVAERYFLYRRSDPLRLLLLLTPDSTAATP